MESLPSFIPFRKTNSRTNKSTIVKEKQLRVEKIKKIKKSTNLTIEDKFIKNRSLGLLLRLQGLSLALALGLLSRETFIILSKQLTQC